MVSRVNGIASDYGYNGPACNGRNGDRTRDKY